MNLNPHLFNKEDLRTFLEGRRAEMRVAAGRMNAEEVSEGHQGKAVDLLCTLARIEPLCLEKGAIQVSEEAPMMDFSRNEMLPELVKYHIPFRGCVDLFHKKPPQRRNITPIGRIVDGELEVKYALETADKVKTLFAQYLVEVTWWIERVNAEVREFNEGLRPEAIKLIESRRQALHHKREFYSQLGYPRKGY